MGSRNLDRISMAQWRRSVRTVEDMLRRGWVVVSHCRTCGLIMVVNLRLVARISGPKTILWNRKQRCRRIGCNGFVDFELAFLGLTASGRWSLNGKPAMGRAMTKPEPAHGVALSRYRALNADVQLIGLDCFHTRVFERERVIDRLIARGIGDGSTGVEAVGHLVRKPCSRCGGLRFETHPAFHSRS